VRSSDSGSLSSADIRAVIDAKKADVKKCYEAALTRNSALAGRITVSITIGADGKVTSVRVAATNLNNTEMERCLLEILKGLVFKAPGKEVKVSYPFTFNPGD